MYGDRISLPLHPYDPLPSGNFNWASWLFFLLNFGTLKRLSPSSLQFPISSAREGGGGVWISFGFTQSILFLFLSTYFSFRNFILHARTSSSNWYFFLDSAASSFGLASPMRLKNHFRTLKSNTLIYKQRVLWDHWSKKNQYQMNLIPNTVMQVCSPVQCKRIIIFLADHQNFVYSLSH